MMTVMMCMTVVGCSNAGTAEKETEASTEEGTSESGGVVKLKVWAEEANWEVTNKMIASFKEKYKNEAILSPCLLDYFIYNIVGKQFCKESLCKVN